MCKLGQSLLVSEKHSTLFAPSYCPQSQTTILSLVFEAFSHKKKLKTMLRSVILRNKFSSKGLCANLDSHSSLVKNSVRCCPLLLPPKAKQRSLASWSKLFPIKKLKTMLRSVILRNKFSSKGFMCKLGQSLLVSEKLSTLLPPLIAPQSQTTILSLVVEAFSHKKT